MKTLPFPSRLGILVTALLAAGPCASAAESSSPAAAPSGQHHLADGPFEPKWKSLTRQYRTPTWFRDAKFGIWAHWSAQCVPEQGDWYARQMYQQGNRVYEYHVSHYGHPSKFGFMEIDNLWKAEKWDPEK